jgi:transcriptional regulator with XRE-family HTH domain
MEIYASFVKQKRTEKNWTQQHLADACDLSLRTIQRVERYGNASNETVSALAAVFEVEQNEIIKPEVETEVINVGSKEPNPWVERITLVITSVALGFALALIVM